MVGRAGWTEWLDGRHTKVGGIVWEIYRGHRKEWKQAGHSSKFEKFEAALEEVVAAMVTVSVTPVSGTKGGEEKSGREEGRRKHSSKSDKFGKIRE